MSPTAACGLLLAASTLIGILTTAFARVISHKTGILDYPDARKIHSKPIAYLGGLGICLTMLIGVAILAWLAPLYMAGNQQVIFAFVAGLIVIFLVGLWDDVAGMRPIMKLGCQLGVAAGLWFAGVRIERITVGFGEPLGLMAQDSAGPLIAVIRSLPSFLLTVGWFAALMNAINLIDGLDGLAGGVCFIAALSLGAVGLMIAPFGMGLTLGMALPVIAAGACLGFLFHNWHPARIFLGDSGSMSIGYILAAASLVSSTKAPALLTLLLPLIALGLPLFETIFSFTRRILTGSHPFKADRRHLHHRLLDVGLSQRRVVLVFLYVTLFLGINSVLLAQGRSVLLLANVVVLGIGVLMLIEYLSFMEKRRNEMKSNDTVNG